MLNSFLISENKNGWEKKKMASGNGDYGLNECSRVYGVPKATIKRLADNKNAFVNERKALGRQNTLIYRRNGKSFV